MSLEIKNLTQAQAQLRGAKDERGVDASRRLAMPDSGSGQARPDSADQITLTSTARRLTELAQPDADQAGVNRSRVDELRQAIQEGHYEINPQRIAEKLIAFERGL